MAAAWRASWSRSDAFSAAVQALESWTAVIVKGEAVDRFIHYSFTMNTHDASNFLVNVNSSYQSEFIVLGSTM